MSTPTSHGTDNDPGTFLKPKCGGIECKYYPGFDEETRKCIDAGLSRLIYQFRTKRIAHLHTQYVEELLKKADILS